ncbi:hypothetical protein [Glutamicibacter sp.]|jgi:hypothetical protein|uniref:hypothetical protein n=1 Tax=Glutamicibacter sp. TaxID=1931995 RepID=UPI002B45CE3C|nr:hypothetical protein [Glutamicibacter sp.]HJX80093.1 hypothetical protein [Glutamicibacter sp.]
MSAVKPPEYKSQDWQPTVRIIAIADWHSYVQDSLLVTLLTSYEVSRPNNLAYL